MIFDNLNLVAFLVFVGIPAVAWFLLKKAVYQLTYLVAKTIKDAHKTDKND